MDSREIKPSVTNGRGADSGQIKAEIDHTRERIDDTLEALADKLHPRHLVSEAVDYLRNPKEMGGTASKLGQAVWHQIQEHPMPALLIGAGIAWMLSEQRHVRGEEFTSSGYGYGEEESSTFSERTGRMRQRVRERASALGHVVSEKASVFTHNVSEKATNLGQSVSEKASSLTQNVKEKASELAHNVREKSEEMAHTIKERSTETATRLKEATMNMSTQTRDQAAATWQRTEEKLSETVDNYPLALGFGCLAMGVLAGLAFPRTRLEDQALGERADELKQKVREQGREVVETAQRAVSAVAQTATEEAEKHGLTPQQLGEKIQHVATEAARAAADTAHREGLDKDALAQQVQTVASEAKRAAQEEINKQRRSQPAI